MSEPFFYTIHISDNDCSEVHISKVTRNGKDITEFVTSSSAGEFGWDENGEYGPFGSFYAVFDQDGSMCYHLDAKDLTRDVSGRKVINEEGLLLPDGDRCPYYSIFWVLPKVYIGSSESTLTISDSPESGGIPFAHSLDTDAGKKEFSYLGIGVYHSYVKDGRAFSMQGVRPSVNMSVIDFGRCAEAYKLSSKNPGYSMQWNWFQWSLLKYCTYIALGTFDSQSFAKGNVGGVPISNSSVDTGMAAVAENGYFAKSDDRSSERLFIENAWGNVSALLSNAFFMSDGLYVSQSPVGQDSCEGKGMRKITDRNYSFTNMKNPGSVETGSTECWGCPVFGANAERYGLKVSARVKGSGFPVAFVGGFWAVGPNGGVSHIDAITGVDNSGEGIGSRIAVLFDIDSDL